MILVALKKEKRHQCKQLHLEHASMSDHNSIPPRPYHALDPISADASSSTAAACTEVYINDIQLFIDDPGAGDAIGIWQASHKLLDVL